MLTDDNLLCMLKLIIFLFQFFIWNIVFHYFSGNLFIYKSTDCLDTQWELEKNCSRKNFCFCGMFKLSWDSFNIHSTTHPNQKLFVTVFCKTNSNLYRLNIILRSVDFLFRLVSENCHSVNTDNINKIRALLQICAINCLMISIRTPDALFSQTW